MDTSGRKRIGEILIERGKLDAAGLDRALRVQQESGEKLGALLVTLGVCAQRDVTEALAVQLGLPLVDASGYPEFPILEERISARFLREARALPVREDERELALAMADPTDAYTIGAFRMVTGREVRPLVAIPTELDAALERLYGAGRTAVGQIVGDVEQRSDDLSFDADVQQLKDLAAEAPVIRLVSLIITNALDGRASDIHIEPFENRLRRPLPDRRRAARGRIAAAALLGRGDLRASRSWRTSTSPSAGCRRTAASGCGCRARRSICASRRCRRCTANRS